MQRQDVLKSRTISEEAWQQIQKKLNELISKNEENNQIVQEKIKENEQLHVTIHKLHQKNSELQHLNSLISKNYSDQIEGLKKNSESDSSYMQLLKKELGDRKNDTVSWKIKYFEIEKQMALIAETEKEIIKYLPFKNEAQQQLKDLQKQLDQQEKENAEEKQVNGQQIQNLKQEIESLTNAKDESQKLVKELQKIVESYKNKYSYKGNSSTAPEFQSFLQKQADASDVNKLKDLPLQNNEIKNLICLSCQNSLMQESNKQGRKQSCIPVIVATNQLDTSFNEIIASLEMNNLKKSKVLEQGSNQENNNQQPNLKEENLDKKADNVIQIQSREASLPFNDEGSMFHQGIDPLSSYREANKSHFSDINIKTNRKSSEQNDEYEDLLALNNKSFNSDQHSPDKIGNFLSEDKGQRFSFQNSVECSALAEQKIRKGVVEANEKLKKVAESEVNNTNGENSTKQPDNKKVGEDKAKQPQDSKLPFGAQQIFKKRLSFQKELQIKIFQSQNNSETSEKQETSPEKELKVQPSLQSQSKPEEKIDQPQISIQFFRGQEELEQRIQEERDKQSALARRLVVMEEEKTKFLLLLKQKEIEVEEMHLKEVNVLEEKIMILEKYQTELQGAVQELQQELSSRGKREDMIINQMDKSKEEILRKTEKIESMKKEIHQLNINLSSFQGQWGDQNEKVYRLENQNQELRARLSEMEQRVQMLDSIIQKERKEEQKVEDIQSELRSTKFQLEDLKSEYAQIVHEMTTTLNGIEEKLKEEKIQFKQAEAALEKEIVSQRNTFTSEKVELERRIVQLKLQTEQQQDIQQNLINELEDEKEKENMVREEHNKKEEEMKDMSDIFQQTVQILEKKLQQLAEKNEELAKNNDDLAKRNEELINVIESKEQNEAALINNLKICKEKISEQEKMQQTLESHINSAREIVEDFQKERNAYEEKIRDLAKLISDLKSTIAFTEKERREWQLLSEIRTKQFDESQLMVQQLLRQQEQGLEEIKSSSSRNYIPTTKSYFKK